MTDSLTPRKSPRARRPRQPTASSPGPTRPPTCRLSLWTHVRFSEFDISGVIVTCSFGLVSFSQIILRFTHVSRINSLSLFIASSKYTVEWIRRDAFLCLLVNLWVTFSFWLLKTELLLAVTCASFDTGVYFRFSRV